MLIDAVDRTTGEWWRSDGSEYDYGIVMTVDEFVNGSGTFVGSSQTSILGEPRNWTEVMIYALDLLALVQTISGQKVISLYYKGGPVFECSTVESPVYIDDVIVSGDDSLVTLTETTVSYMGITTGLSLHVNGSTGLKIQKPMDSIPIKYCSSLRFSMRIVDEGSTPIKVGINNTYWYEIPPLGITWQTYDLNLHFFEDSNGEPLTYYDGVITSLDFDSSDGEVWIDNLLLYGEKGIYLEETMEFALEHPEYTNYSLSSSWFTDRWTTTGTGDIEITSDLDDINSSVAQIDLSLVESLLVGVIGIGEFTLTMQVLNADGSYSRDLVFPNKTLSGWDQFDEFILDITGITSGERYLVFPKLQGEGQMFFGGILGISKTDGITDSVAPSGGYVPKGLISFFSHESEEDEWLLGEVEEGETESTGWYEDCSDISDWTQGDGDSAIDTDNGGWLADIDYGVGVHSGVFTPDTPPSTDWWYYPAYDSTYRYAVIYKELGLTDESNDWTITTHLNFNNYSTSNPYTYQGFIMLYLLNENKDPMLRLYYNDGSGSSGNHYMNIQAIYYDTSGNEHTILDPGSGAGCYDINNGDWLLTQESGEIKAWWDDTDVGDTPGTNTWHNLSALAGTDILQRGTASYILYWYRTRWNKPTDLEIIDITLEEGGSSGGSSNEEYLEDFETGPPLENGWTNISAPPETYFTQDGQYYQSPSYSGHHGGGGSGTSIWREDKFCSAGTHTEGTLKGWVYSGSTNWQAESDIYLVYVDSSNYIRMYLYKDGPRLQKVVNGASTVVGTTCENWVQKWWQFSLTLDLSKSGEELDGWIKTGTTQYELNGLDVSDTEIEAIGAGYVALGSRVGYYGSYWYDDLTLTVDNNLVQNGDFETGDFTSWDDVAWTPSGSSSVQNTDMYQGTYSAELVCTNNYNREGKVQSTPKGSSDTYYFSFAMKDNGGSLAEAGLMIYYYEGATYKGRTFFMCSNEYGNTDSTSQKIIDISTYTNNQWAYFKDIELNDTSSYLPPDVKNMWGTIDTFKIYLALYGVSGYGSNITVWYDAVYLDDNPLEQSESQIPWSITGGNMLVENVQGEGTNAINILRDDYSDMLIQTSFTFEIFGTNPEAGVVIRYADEDEDAEDYAIAKVNRSSGTWYASLELWINGAENEWYWPLLTDLYENIPYIMTVKLENNNYIELYLDGKKYDISPPETYSLEPTGKLGLYATNSQVIFHDLSVNPIEGYSLDEMINANGLTNGLMGYYTFDETTGSTIAFDNSGYKNHGTISSVTTGYQGQVELAYKFDGSVSDYLTLPTEVIDGLQNYTVAFWVNSNNITKPINTVLHGTKTGGNDFSIEFEDDRVDHLTTQGTYSWTSASHCNNVWYHVVLVREDNTLYFYENGVLKHSLSCYTNPVDITGGMLVLGQEQDAVGGGFDPTQALEGYLDELRIYNWALSEDDISMLYYNSSLIIPKTGIGEQGLTFTESIPDELYWKMDEGENTILYDSSGCNRYATIYNATWDNDLLFFDGNDDWAELSSMEGTILSDPTGQDVTWSFKFYQDSLDIDYSYIVSSGGQTGAARGFAALINSSGNMYVGYGAQYSLVNTGYSIPISKDEWHIVYATYTGSASNVVDKKLTVYMDGNIYGSYSSNTRSDTPDGYTDVTIGVPNNAKTINEFMGYIREVKCWNAIITPDTDVGQISYLPNHETAPILDLMLIKNKNPDYPSDNTQPEYLVFDYSGNDNIGIPKGGANYNSIEGAYYFDGVDDYIEVQDAPGFDNQNAISVVMWIKPTANMPYGCLASKRDAWILHPGNGDNTIRFDVFYGSYPNYHTTGYSTETIPLNEWIQVIGVYDHSKSIFKVYLNGEEVASNSNTQGPINNDTGPIHIGKDETYPSGRNFTGYIGSIKIYDYALTADEILYDFYGSQPVIIPAGRQLLSEENPVGLAEKWSFMSLLSLADAYPAQNELDEECHIEDFENGLLNWSVVSNPPTGSSFDAYYDIDLNQTPQVFDPIADDLYYVGTYLHDPHKNQFIRTWCLEDGDWWKADPEYDAITVQYNAPSNWYETWQPYASSGTFTGQGDPSTAYLAAKNSGISWLQSHPNDDFVYNAYWYDFEPMLRAVLKIWRTYPYTPICPSNGNPYTNRDTAIAEGEVWLDTYCEDEVYVAWLYQEQPDWMVEIIRVYLDYDNPLYTIEDWNAGTQFPGNQLHTDLVEHGREWAEYDIMDHHGPAPTEFKYLITDVFEKSYKVYKMRWVEGYYYVGRFTGGTDNSHYRIDRYNSVDPHIAGSIETWFYADNNEAKIGLIPLLIDANNYYIVEFYNDGIYIGSVNNGQFKWHYQDSYIANIENKWWWAEVSLENHYSCHELIVKYYCPSLGTNKEIGPIIIEGNNLLNGVGYAGLRTRHTYTYYFDDLEINGSTILEDPNFDGTIAEFNLSNETVCLKTNIYVNEANMDGKYELIAEGGSERQYLGIFSHTGFSDTKLALPLSHETRYQDLSGYGHHGILNGGTWDAEGYYFDGVDDYIEISDFVLTDEFTILLWIDPERVNSPENIIAKYNVLNETSFELIQTNNGTYEIHLNGEVYSTGGTRSTGWQHIAIVVKKSTQGGRDILFYKNGQNLSINNDQTTGDWSGGSWLLGITNGMTNDFKGHMGNVSIINDALPESTIETIAHIFDTYSTPSATPLELTIEANNDNIVIYASDGITSELSTLYVTSTYLNRLKIGDGESTDLLGVDSLAIAPQNELFIQPSLTEAFTTHFEPYLTGSIDNLYHSGNSIAASTSTSGEVGLIIDFTGINTDNKYLSADVCVYNSGGNGTNTFKITDVASSTTYSWIITDEVDFNTNYYLGDGIYQNILIPLDNNATGLQFISSVTTTVDTVYTELFVDNITILSQIDLQGVNTEIITQSVDHLLLQKNGIYRLIDLGAVSDSNYSYWELNEYHYDLTEKTILSFDYCLDADTEEEIIAKVGVHTEYGYFDLDIGRSGPSYSLGDIDRNNCLDITNRWCHVEIPLHWYFEEYLSLDAHGTVDKIHLAINENSQACKFAFNIKNILLLENDQTVSLLNLGYDLQDTLTTAIGGKAITEWLASPFYPVHSNEVSKRVLPINHVPNGGFEEYSWLSGSSQYAIKNWTKSTNGEIGITTSDVFDGNSALYLRGGTNECPVEVSTHIQPCGSTDFTGKYVVQFRAKMEECEEPNSMQLTMTGYPSTYSDYESIEVSNYWKAYEHIIDLTTATDYLELVFTSNQLENLLIDDISLYPIIEGNYEHLRNFDSTRVAKGGYFSRYAFLDGWYNLYEDQSSGFVNALRDVGTTAKESITSAFAQYYYTEIFIDQEEIISDMWNLSITHTPTTSGQMEGVWCVWLNGIQQITQRIGDEETKTWWDISLNTGRNIIMLGYVSESDANTDLRFKVTLTSSIDSKFMTIAPHESKTRQFAVLYDPQYPTNWITREAVVDSTNIEKHWFDAYGDHNCKYISEKRMTADIKMNEGEGSRVIDYSYRWDYSYPITNVAWVNSDDDYTSLDFSATNARIQLPDLIPEGTTDFTMSVWIKDIDSPGNYGTILSMVGRNGEFGEYPIIGNGVIEEDELRVGFIPYNDTFDKQYIHVYLNGENYSFCEDYPRVPIGNDTWRNLMVIRHGATLEVYLDFHLIESITDANTTPLSPLLSTPQIYLGVEQDADLSFDTWYDYSGCMREFKFFSYALNEEERKQVLKDNYYNIVEDNVALIKDGIVANLISIGMPSIVMNANRLQNYLFSEVNMYFPGGLFWNQEVVWHPFGQILLSSDVLPSNIWHGEPNDSPIEHFLDAGGKIIFPGGYPAFGVYADKAGVLSYPTGPNTYQYAGAIGHQYILDINNDNNDANGLGVRDDFEVGLIAYDPLGTYADDDYDADFDHSTETYGIKEVIGADYNEYWSPNRNSNFDLIKYESIEGNHAAFTQAQWTGLKAHVIFGKHEFDSLYRDGDNPIGPPDNWAIADIDGYSAYYNGEHPGSVSHDHPNDLIYWEIEEERLAEKGTDPIDMGLWFKPYLGDINGAIEDDYYNGDVDNWYVKHNHDYQVDYYYHHELWNVGVGSIQSGQDGRGIISLLPMYSWDDPELPLTGIFSQGLTTDSIHYARASDRGYGGITNSPVTRNIARTMLAMSTGTMMTLMAVDNIITNALRDNDTNAAGNLLNPTFVDEGKSYEKYPYEYIDQGYSLRLNAISGADGDPDTWGDNYANYPFYTGSYSKWLFAKDIQMPGLETYAEESDIDMGDSIIQLVYEGNNLFTTLPLETGGYEADPEELDPHPYPEYLSINGVVVNGKNDTNNIIASIMVPNCDYTNSMYSTEITDVTSGSTGRMEIGVNSGTHITVNGENNDSNFYEWSSYPKDGTFEHMSESVLASANLAASPLGQEYLIHNYNMQREIILRSPLMNMFNNQRGYEAGLSPEYSTMTVIKRGNDIDNNYWNYGATMFWSLDSAIIAEDHWTSDDNIRSLLTLGGIYPTEPLHWKKTFLQETINFSYSEVEDNRAFWMGGGGVYYQDGSTPCIWLSKSSEDKIWYDNNSGKDISLDIIRITPALNCSYDDEAFLNVEQIKKLRISITDNYNSQTQEKIPDCEYIIDMQQWQTTDFVLSLNTMRSESNTTILYNGARLSFQILEVWDETYGEIIDLNNKIIENESDANENFGGFAEIYLYGNVFADPSGSEGIYIPIQTETMFNTPPEHCIRFEDPQCPTAIDGGVYWISDENQNTRRPMNAGGYILSIGVEKNSELIETDEPIGSLRYHTAINVKFNTISTDFTPEFIAYWKAEVKRQQNLQMTFLVVSMVTAVIFAAVTAGIGAAIAGTAWGGAICTLFGFAAMTGVSVTEAVIIAGTTAAIYMVMILLSMQVSQALHISWLMPIISIGLQHDDIFWGTLIRIVCEGIDTFSPFQLFGHKRNHWCRETIGPFLYRGYMLTRDIRGTIPRYTAAVYCQAFLGASQEEIDYLMWDRYERALLSGKYYNILDLESYYVYEY